MDPQRKPPSIDDYLSSAHSRFSGLNMRGKMTQTSHGVRGNVRNTGTSGK